MSTDRVVDAAFNPPGVLLTIAGAGNGRGVVTGPGINCTIDNGNPSGQCQISVAPGTSIGLQATAAAGSSGGFGAPCASSGTQCTVTVTQNQTITGVFNVLAPAPPVISNLVLTATELNSAVCAVQYPQFPTRFVMQFNFTDPNGNITGNGSTLGVATRFLPSNTQYMDSFNIAPSNGYNGAVGFWYCAAFNADSSVSYTATIRDDGGLTSNSLTLTIQRPQGALKISGSGGIGRSTVVPILLPVHK
jgi:hypothetical protein